ncbi:MAG: cyclic nucleotide-binding domain-containing protein [Anaerolineae bacterium]
MDLVDRLSASTLFQNLDGEDLASVAALAREHHVPAGRTLCRQADIGTTFFVIDSGEAIVRRVDDKGFARPVATLREGDSFGITSLLLSEPRDATVISQAEMHVWTIERQAFQELLSQRPSIVRSLAIPDDIAIRQRMPTYSWLAPSEQVVLSCHKHWMPLVLLLGGATLLLVLMFGAVVAYLIGSSQAWDPTLWLIIPGALYLAFVVWHWFDWVNDQVVVTTQRISFREQVALFYEARNEVPIDRVQNINVVLSFMGRLLNYGTMVIETAAETGTLTLDQIPFPERVRDAIWDQTERAQATQRATERRLMADALTSQLGIDTHEQLPQDVVPGEGLADGGPQASDDDGLRGAWRRAVVWIQSLDLFPRAAIAAADQVVWRKHAIFLVRAMLLPLLITLTMASLAVLSWFGVPALLADYSSIYSPVVLVLAIVSGLWLLWVVVDWANDQYIITNDRIIDVEQRPFSMRSERREASLAVIQNVRFVIPHFWAALWGYGNVVVQTAGRGDFTFDRVGRPGDVQAEIFRRIEAYRERGRQQEATRHRREMAEWFSIYRDLEGSAGVDPAASGRPPSAPLGDVGSERSELLN